jgi:hypothetical protein
MRSVCVVHKYACEHWNITAYVYTCHIIIQSVKFFRWDQILSHMPISKDINPGLVE